MNRMENMLEEEQQKPIYQPDENQITFFGQANFRDSPHRFGIKRGDRRRHMYVIGKTGMGKSTMLENMIIQDIQNGEGVAVIDPHGDLVEKVINYVPDHRIQDVVYINPADIDHPVAFNILENVGLEYRNLVSDGLVGVFKKIWADSWGPRLEYILINTILALLEYPGSTLLGVMRMLVDTKYRRKVVKKVTDPVVRSFWINEFNNYSEKFRNEAIAPIQNKIGQFLSSALIRNIVGQSQSTINMRQLMDEGKIIMLNLSKGRIGEENSALLGAMIITKIQLAAMSRVDTPEENRRDFYLYVDEFQNFSTDSFAGILSEARKYRLNITMAHQYIEQLSDEVRAAVFGNVGTMAAFRVGATDAEELEKEFMPTFTQEDIIMLPAFHIYLRLMIDGVASSPFSATTLSPISQPTGNGEIVIVESQKRYANNRTEVEEEILRWTGDEDNMPPALKKLEQEKEKNPEKKEPLQQKEQKKEVKEIKQEEVKQVKKSLPVPLPPKPPVVKQQAPAQQKAVRIQTQDVQKESVSMHENDENFDDLRKKRLSFVQSSLSPSHNVADSSHNVVSNSNKSEEKNSPVRKPELRDRVKPQEREERNEKKKEIEKESSDTKKANSIWQTVQDPRKKEEKRKVQESSARDDVTEQEKKSTTTTSSQLPVVQQLNQFVSSDSTKESTKESANERTQQPTKESTEEQKRKRKRKRKRSSSGGVATAAVAPQSQLSKQSSSQQRSLPSSQNEQIEQRSRNKSTEKESPTQEKPKPLSPKPLQPGQPVRISSQGVQKQEE